MGDVQQYFIDHKVRNFYSVSISGYHIAEAGANPITQLAFTLANGFTYVEYYLARGMDIDAFAPNLSFFFSNGLDPEYSVMGRVARRIWARVLKHRYGANERSQQFKYHIQTSGRSLHAREIQFNDIRTTLQALTAVYDNCNSLHTNAYDEAITTPTAESVRRAMAIQQIIHREFGVTPEREPAPGLVRVEELTDLVEEAVLSRVRAASTRAVACSGRSSSNTSEAGSRKSRFTTSSRRTAASFPSSASTVFARSGGSRTSPSREIELARASDGREGRSNRRLRSVSEETRSRDGRKRWTRLQRAAVEQGETSSPSS